MNKKVISFALYGNDPKYYLGAEQNVIEAQKIYPDWICRFYCKKDVPNIEKLKNNKNVEIILIEDNETIPPVYLRFLVADDPEVDIFMIRDCDSIVNYREQAAVEEWLNSDKILHLMHDHERHFWLVMAGMWGLKNQFEFNMRDTIKKYISEKNKSNYTWGDDQHFLGDYILPLFKDSVIDHNSTYIKWPYSKDFPQHEKIEYGKFVGDVIYPTTYLNLKNKNKDNLFIIGNQSENDHIYLSECLEDIINKYKEIVIFIREDRKDFCQNIYKFKNIKLIVGKEKSALTFYKKFIQDTHDFLGLGVYGKNFKGIYTKESILEDINKFKKNEEFKNNESIDLKNLGFFDFIDIGTSDFDVADGKFENNKKYILIEPIKHYLDKLPNKENIIKVNSAVSDSLKEVDLFYIKEEDIIKYNLPWWLRGCNSIENSHPTVLTLLKANNISKDIISNYKIKTITFDHLINKFKIKFIDQLKIDTEGHDHFILKDVLKNIEKKEIKINKIIFEYNSLSNKEYLDKLINDLIALNYESKLNGENFILENKIQFFIKK
jgi:FkbM family methyltransferase